MSALLERLGSHASPRSAARPPLEGPAFEHHHFEVDADSSFPLAGVAAPIRLPSRARFDADLRRCRAPQGGGRCPGLVFDTETTGLGGGAMAFVVGIAYPRDETWRVEQWTLGRVGGERSMLRAVFERIAEVDPVRLLSFNGASYDLPLFRSRSTRTGTPASALERPHLDMLHLARRLWQHAERDCRLQTLERSRLAWLRVGDIPGWEIPEVFAHYLEARGCPRARERMAAVRRHNAVDLLSVVGLVERAAQMLERPPDLASAHAVALALCRAGDPGAALELLAPRVDSHWGRGRGPLRDAALLVADLYRRHGEDEQAARLWTRVLEAFPGDPDACEALAKHLEHRVRDPAAALKVAEASDAPSPRRVARLRAKRAREGRRRPGA